MSLKNKMFIALGVIWFFTGTKVIGPLVFVLASNPYVWLTALIASILFVQWRRNRSTSVERLNAK